MTLRVGILGLGLMGQRLLDAIDHHPEFESVVGFDPDLDRAGEVGAKYRFDVTETEEDLFALPDLDLVYIASPPRHHVPSAWNALNREVPIFVEKPLAVDLEEAQSWVNEVESRQHPVAVNFPFATLPGFQRICRECSAETNQPLQRIEIFLHFSCWPRTWHHAGPWLSGPLEGGFLREVFSHFLFLTHRVCGPTKVKSVQLERDRETGVESSVLATLIAGETPVTLIGAVGGAAPDENRWTAIGSEASFRLTDWGRVEVTDGSQWSEVSAESGETRGLEGQLDQLARMVGGKDHRLATAREALEVAQSVESLLTAGN